MSSRTSANSSAPPDTSHAACIGGRQMTTCTSCAGNPPRGSNCTKCDGKGFTVQWCAYCYPQTSTNGVKFGLGAGSTGGNMGRIGLSTKSQGGSGGFAGVGLGA